MKNEIELPDHTIKELCSIGLEVVLNRYFEKLKDRAEDDGEEWDGDGLHYVDYGAGERGVHHKMKQSCKMKQSSWWLGEEKEDDDAL